jgi:hypothetical protein
VLEADQVHQQSLSKGQYPKIAASMMLLDAPTGHGALPMEIFLCCSPNTLYEHVLYNR